MSSLTKSTIMYKPLVGHTIRIKCYDNTLFEGIVEFETKNTFHISLRVDETNYSIKVILKSAMRQVFLYNEENKQFVEINVRLLQGTLISRLKKMK
ncbi:MAG: hypothetical protein ACLFPL_01985 [Candidatus Nanoarchaeia archaeon]